MHERTIPPTHAAASLIASQSLSVVRTPYGKASIRSFSASPDGWAQMLIQLAYARLLRSLSLRREGGTYDDRRFVPVKRARARREPFLCVCMRTEKER